MVAELSTSRHDVQELQFYFETLKFSYEGKFDGQQLIFRMVVIDYSLVLIHGLLKSFNSETIQDYANRIYDLSTGWQFIFRFLHVI